MVVIPMEEAAFLIPVHRIVRGIEVENEFRRGCRKRCNESVENDAMNGASHFAVSALFKSAQCGTGCTRRDFAERGLQRQIVEQSVVIVEMCIRDRLPLTLKGNLC